MQTPAIPERVFALCKAITNKEMAEKDLKELLEPSHLGGKTVYFGIVRTAAEQLGLINIKDDTISLAIGKENVISIETMRKYINLNLENHKESLFYNVTKAYFSMGIEVFEHENVSKMCDLIGEKINRKVDEDDMRAWRFWVSYLGMGYMHDMLMLPNASTMISDVVYGRQLKKDVEYSMSEFIDEIRPYCDILLENVEEENKFNYGFSNGLRSLHDQGKIILQHKLDRGDMWFLYPLEFHAIKETVTHITIRR